MQPPVAAVIEAHRALERLVAGLDDQQVAGASTLPGWSRGHVLAHLTDNARMFARLAEHALRGELVAGYDGGMAERNAIIHGLPQRRRAPRRTLRAHGPLGGAVGTRRRSGLDPAGHVPQRGPRRDGLGAPP